MTPPPGAASRPLRPVDASGGEVEHERLSRRANALEALVVYLLIHAALHTGIGRPPHAGDASWVRAAGLVLAGLLGIYTIAAAPRLHGDSRHARGLPQPLELLALWRQWNRLSRLAAAALGLGLPILLMSVGWRAVLIRVGIRLTWPGVFEQLVDRPWNAVGIAVASVMAGLALSWFVIRWSNLLTASRALAWPVGALLAGIVGVAAAEAAADGDWTRFLQFAWTGDSGRAFLPQVAAYLPWGLLQQWLLLAYFSTRVRRAVPPCGWAGLPGRAVTAGLTGVAFGALHWPNVPLAVLTFASGCVSGWLFQQDRGRNLFLLGLAHAVAGALVAALTAVRMGVGPPL